nr:GNAT family N-acetyltransferase [Lachnospiraceae bacterium]
MQKVNRENYDKFIKLANANTCNTVYPMSIAEGFQEGDIYTDYIDVPTYALFWHVSGFAYLTGRPDTEDLDAIYRLMKNEDGKNPRRFVLELKDEDVADYFRNKGEVEEHPRYRFRLAATKNKISESKLIEKQIPSGYELREVNADLLPKISGRIVPSNFWSSAEEFLQKGKGYCLMCGDEVAAVAFSAAVSSEQVDIGIETKESYRRKGLATIVAGEMVSYVRSIGKEPVWDCDAANIGSKATAEKVGFEVMSEHAYYKV